MGGMVGDPHDLCRNASLGAKVTIVWTLAQNRAASRPRRNRRLNIQHSMVRSQSDGAATDNRNDKPQNHAEAHGNELRVNIVVLRCDSVCFGGLAYVGVVGLRRVLAGAIGARSRGALRRVLR